MHWNRTVLPLSRARLAVALIWYGAAETKPISVAEVENMINTMGANKAKVSLASTQTLDLTPCSIISAKVSGRGLCWFLVWRRAPDLDHGYDVPFIETSDAFNTAYRPRADSALGGAHERALAEKRVLRRCGYGRECVAGLTIHPLGLEADPAVRGFLGRRF